MGQSILEIARARAVHPPGAVPSETVDAARDAEFVFATAAQDDIVTNSVRCGAFIRVPPRRGLMRGGQRTAPEDLRAVVGPTAVEDAQEQVGQ